MAPECTESGLEQHLDRAGGAVARDAERLGCVVEAEPVVHQRVDHLGPRRQQCSRGLELATLRARGRTSPTARSGTSLVSSAASMVTGSQYVATTTTAPPGRTRATASSSDDCVPAASTTAPYSSASSVPAPRSPPPARWCG